jgi:hypothetical protein
MKPNKYQLNKYAVSGIGFPEFFGNTHFFTLKDPVEIGDIVKAAFIGNFGYRGCGVNKHPGSMSKPDLVQTVNKGFARALFDKPTK